MKKVLFALGTMLFLALNSFATVFPVPTGPHMVGTTTFVVEDTSREEPYSEAEGDFRKLLVRAWYPAEVNGEARLPYIDEYHKEIYTKYFMIPVADIDAAGLSNSFIDAKLSHNEEEYPVVIYAHGLGSTEMDNIQLMEELASQGYIVYSINYTFLSGRSEINGETFWFSFQGVPREELPQLFKESQEMKQAIVAAATPEEKQNVMAEYNRTSKRPKVYGEGSKVMVADTLFFIESLDDEEGESELVNSLKEASDLDNLGMFGYSFGGNTATLISTMEDSPLEAAANLDGAIFPPVDAPELQGFNVEIPFLFMSSDRAELSDALMQPYFYGAEEEAYNFIIKDTLHNNYSYLGYFSALQNINFIGTLPSNTYTYIMRETIVPFFDSILKDDGEDMDNSDLASDPTVIYNERNID